MLGATRLGGAVGLALWIPVLLLGAGCASTSLSVTEGGFEHRRHDFTINGAPAGWKRVDVEGAVLTYRRRGPNTMTLQSRCGRPVATPQLMARHLVIGLPDRELVAAGPIPVDGRNGWAQVFDTVRGDVSIRVKTVTVVASDCTFDWVLGSTGDFDAAEVEFDAWWGTFRLGARYDEPEVGG
jgi:hypothetical protein